METSELKKRLNEYFEKGYRYFPVDGDGEYGTNFHDYLNDENIIPWDNDTDNFLKPFFYWIEYISEHYDFFNKNEKLITFVVHNNNIGYLVFGNVNNWDYKSIDISDEDNGENDNLEWVIDDFSEKYWHD